jgi:hypothetical protein
VGLDVDEDPEIAWRVDALRARLPADGSVPQDLTILDLPPEPGRCRSCGNPQLYGQSGKCTRCCLAAVSVLRALQALPAWKGSTHETDKIVREASSPLGDGQVGVYTIGRNCQETGIITLIGRFRAVPPDVSLGRTPTGHHAGSPRDHRCAARPDRSLSTQRATFTDAPSVHADQDT